MFTCQEAKFSGYGRLCSSSHETGSQWWVWLRTDEWFMNDFCFLASGGIFFSRVFLCSAHHLSVKGNLQVWQNTLLIRTEGLGEKNNPKYHKSRNLIMRVRRNVPKAFLSLPPHICISLKGAYSGKLIALSCMPCVLVVFPACSRSNW